MNMNKLLLSFFLLCLFVTDARASAWQRSPEVGVRLLSAVESVGESDTLSLGLEIGLAPGWKTYWRNPGTAGYPARIDWAGSENFSEATILWPAPQRFEFSGLQSFGYENRVILPIEGKIPAPGQPVSLKAAVDLMACEHICVPFTFNLALDLPTGSGDPSPLGLEIERWKRRVPGDGVAVGLSLVEAKIEKGNLVVPVLAEPALQTPDLFADEITLAKPEFVPGHPALLRVPLEGFEGTELTLTLVDGGRSVERRVTVAGQMNSAPPELIHSVGLLQALLAAFIGGLILNLMPCVLPVLSLKILAIVSHGKNPPGHVRASFLASAAGILVSFWILAALAIGFKQAGEAVGWGVQFQHPVFLGTLVFILTLFAASMWDLFHIPLPRFLADAINDRLPAPGDKHDRTLVGNFVTGMFATALATPCSAPFVGTAIGFALAGGAVEILSVATLMGLGLALPFLLVAAFPQVANHLPKPGRWMGWLKGALGIALMLTALWLASVLGVGQNPLVTSMVGGSVFLILFVLWIRASIKRPMVFLKGLFAIAIGILAVQALGIYERSVPPARQAVLINWIPLDEAMIPALVASGKTVFVDVTAEWCLTCKANKKLVLEVEPVLSLLRGENVVAMRADWTRPNPAIGDYLRKFGRYGIPFNAVYGPSAPGGIALPELLTAEAVKSAFDRAAAK
jgi:suppressor for copper-sensitivity B